MDQNEPQWEEFHGAALCYSIRQAINVVAPHAQPKEVGAGESGAFGGHLGPLNVSDIFLRTLDV